MNSEIVLVLQRGNNRIVGKSQSCMNRRPILHEVRKQFRDLPVRRVFRQFESGQEFFLSFDDHIDIVDMEKAMSGNFQNGRCRESRRSALYNRGRPAPGQSTASFFGFPENPAGAWPADELG